jgi:two-component system, cell cycle sensor histidine kinase and response regulator CckA
VVKERNMESLAFLADGLAHDFNNLLMTILGNVSLAKNQLSPGGKPYERLLEAERACMSGKGLTRRLLTFSKSGKPSMKVISLSPLLKEWAAQVGSQVPIRFFLASDLSPVEADEEQMRQVFAHLLVNAKEAMPHGGTVTIRGENRTLRDEDVPLAAGDYVRLSIEDTGAGIPAENLSRIFDPYFTTKERCAQRGQGLGLTIVYSVLKKHGGYVAVESTVGKGTAFHLYLPAVPKRVVDEVQKEERVEEKSRRILVMDDEGVVRETIAEMLSLIGFEVRCVKAGQEAVEVFEEARQSGVPFDAVILDLMMGEGMGGEETLQMLRALDPAVRAVASSGFAGRTGLAEMKDHGFVAVIGKPYKIEELKETLKKVLEGK